MERLSEAGIIEEIIGLELDFVERTEWNLKPLSRHRRSTLDIEKFRIRKLLNEKMRKTRGFWRGNRALEITQCNVTWYDRFYKVK